MALLVPDPALTETRISFQIRGGSRKETGSQGKLFRISSDEGQALKTEKPRGTGSKDPTHISLSIPSTVTGSEGQALNTSVPLGSEGQALNT